MALRNSISNRWKAMRKTKSSIRWKRCASVPCWRRTSSLGMVNGANPTTAVHGCMKSTTVIATPWAGVTCVHHASYFYASSPEKGLDVLHKWVLNVDVDVKFTTLPFVCRLMTADNRHSKALAVDLWGFTHEFHGNKGCKTLLLTKW